MANTIAVTYVPCESSPVNGYLIKYRPLGSSEPLRIWPVNFFPSPIEITAHEAVASFTTGQDADGTQYEGFIYGDCGGGDLGIAIPWETAEDSASGSASCMPVSFGEDTIPNATVGVEYDVDLTLSGTPPFSLGSVTKPSWMTITVFGSEVHLGGTPDAAGIDEQVSINATNCDGINTDIFSYTIEVIAEDGLGIISNDNCGGSNARIDNVQWNGFDPLTVTGDFPVLTGEEITVSHGTTGASHTLEIFTTNDGGLGAIQAIDSTGAIYCLPFDGSGHYTITGFIIGLVNWSVHMDCETLCS